MRGARRNNFHARDAGASSWVGVVSQESGSSCKAVDNAARTAALMKGGTSCSVGTGHRSSSAKSTASNASKAALGPRPASASQSQRRHSLLLGRWGRPRILRRRSHWTAKVPGVLWSGGGHGGDGGGWWVGRAAVGARAGHRPLGSVRAQLPSHPRRTLKVLLALPL